MIVLGKDVFYIDMAKLVAKRSTCISRQVGAVLVKDDKILAIGYNTTPNSIPKCIERGCARKNSISGTDLDKCFAIHAEMNAILQCTNCKDATLYVTTKPCATCMKHILQVGIKEVVYLEDYNSPLTDELIKLSNIICRKYEG